MALINRITRLFRADLHAVLDRIEEPDALLRESVREMADSIANDERRLKRQELGHAQQTRQEQEISESLVRLTKELDVCFAADQETLARGLIKRRLESERLLTTLQRNRDTTKTGIAELTLRLQEKRTRLAAVEQKLEILAANDSFDDADTNANAKTVTGEFNVGDDEVEVAFLAEQQQRVAS